MFSNTLNSLLLFISLYKTGFLDNLLFNFARCGLFSLWGFATSVGLEHLSPPVAQHRPCMQSQEHTTPPTKFLKWAQIHIICGKASLGINMIYIAVLTLTLLVSYLFQLWSPVLTFRLMKACRSFFSSTALRLGSWIRQRKSWCCWMNETQHPDIFECFFLRKKSSRKNQCGQKEGPVFFFFLRGSFIVVDTGPVFFPKKLCTNSSFPTGVSAKVEC